MPNSTIVRDGTELGHEKFYEYLRLRLPLEVGMVVVRFLYCCRFCRPASFAEGSG